VSKPTMPGLSLKGIALTTTLLTMLVLAVTYYAWGPRHEAFLVGSASTLYASGLTQRLFDGFNAGYGYNVEFKYIVRGSGDLLRLLADGSICVALTHSPPLERKFIREGMVEWHGVVVYNKFVIVGPPGDPAGVSKALNISEAFKRIFEAGERGAVLFVSRGDLSGTHVRELQLWSLTGLDPEGRRWYLRTAQRAHETLIIASNLKAYTFIDEGTFYTLKSKGEIGDLEILFSQDTYLLVNIYSIVTSRNEKCRGGATGELVESIVKYILGEGQDLVEREFGVKGTFYPAKDKREELLRFWEDLSTFKVEPGG